MREERNPVPSDSKSQDRLPGVLFFAARGIRLGRSPAKGVFLGDQRLQARFKHMGVNLGRRNVRMTKHGLDRSQIGPVGQKMGRKGVAQDMGRYALRRDFRFDRHFADQLKQADPA